MKTSLEITQGMVCMIPARLGSKRLAKKNIKPLNGIPMIAYSIRTALESELFDNVYVCTEADAIDSIATQHGATVIRVDDDLCGDLVPSWKPCAAACHQLIKYGHTIHSLLCLQPTSPLRNADDIREAVQTFRTLGPDFLVSVTTIDPHYFHWAMHAPSESWTETDWRMIFGDQYLVERPLLPKRYRPNGSIKIARLDALERVGHFFGDSLACIHTPDERSVHVGTAFDFDLCAFLLQQRNQQEDAS